MLFGSRSVTVRSVLILGSLRGLRVYTYRCTIRCVHGICHDSFACIVATSNQVFLECCTGICLTLHDDTICVLNKAVSVCVKFLKEHIQLSLRWNPEGDSMTTTVHMSSVPFINTDIAKFAWQRAAASPRRFVLNASLFPVSHATK